MSNVTMELLNQNLNDVISYRDFFHAFGFKDTDIIYLRQFFDPEFRSNGRNREVRLSSFDAIIPALHQLEAEKYGTAFVVNGGGQKKDAVTVARAQFADFDDYDFAEQIRRLNDFPLEPSIIIKTRRSLHPYWLLDDGKIERFTNIQRRLIQHFGGDPRIKDESRVMRLYGFYHQKHDPVMVKLIKFDPDIRYTQDQLCELLPDVNESPESQSPRSVPLPDRIPEGERNDTLFRLACSLQAKGLSDEGVMAAVMAENMAKCDPAMGEHEVENIVGSALRYDKGPSVTGERTGKLAVYDPVCDKLEKTDRGGTRQSFKNGLIILRGDPELAGRFRFNELTQWPEYTQLSFFNNPTGIVNDACLRAVREYMTFHYGLQSKDVVDQAVRRECECHGYNPAVDLFGRLAGTWDGVDRFSTYLNTYLGVEISDYSREVLIHTLFGILNRTFNPGCVFDECLVLIGPEQGTGKSSMARMLALNDQWFWACKKLPADLNKFYGNLQGCLVVELEEMAACRGVDIEVLRGIISEREDVFDLKYQNRDRYPRRNIFIGTTNSLDALPRDPAGNRRFLPVLVRPQFATARPYDSRQHREDTLQLYAQAVELYFQGKLPANLSPEVKAMADQMRQAYTPQDANQAMLNAYVDNILKNCSTEDIAAKQRFTVLQTFNEVFNNGVILKSLAQKDQRMMTSYLDHCEKLQRYSGSASHKCRVGMATLLAWEFKPEVIAARGQQVSAFTTS